MIKNIFIAFFKVFVLLIAIQAFSVKLGLAQPTASFNYTVHSSCIPAKITFYNTSEYDSEIGMALWDFGTGSYAGAGSDTIVKFFFNDNVTVGLKVVDESGVSETTQSFEFFNKPKAEFIIKDGKACNNVNATLISNSVQGDAEIVQWQWDFRDGTIQEGKEVTKYYDVIGKYDVLLKVIDANGCIAFKEKEDQIQVLDTISAEFIVDKQFWCQPGHFYFNSLYESEDLMEYKWYLSDGQYSEEPSPAFFISDEGTYDMALRINNMYGCVDSIMKKELITLTNITPSFTMNNGNDIGLNQLVCPGEISFINTSNGDGEFSWYINDSLVGQERDLIYNFYNPGPKEIRLQVGTEECTKIQLKWIVIDSIMAKFSIDKDFACRIPETFHLTNESINASSYTWQFPDGTTVNTTDADFTLNSIERDNDIYRQDIETVEVPVRLQAQSTSGCVSTLEKNLVYRFPRARLIPDITEGCVPLSVKFSSLSVSDSAITTYTWMINNQEAFSGSNQSYTYQFADTGIYQAGLIIQDEANCIDTSLNINISVGFKGNPEFVLANDQTCNKNWIGIHNQTSNPDQFDYFRLVSNGAFSSQAINSTIDSIFINATHAGIFNINLQAVHHGCVSTSGKTDNFEVLSPVAFINAETSCQRMGQFNFKAKPNSGDKVVWNFGTGILGYSADTIYQYPDQGFFKVLLKMSNSSNGCLDADSIVLDIHAPEAVFTTTPDTFACVSNSPDSEFDVFNMYGYDSENEANYCGAAPYIWNTGFEKNWERTRKPFYFFPFSSAGDSIRKVQLVVENNDGCTDTMFRYYDIIEPELDFMMDTLSGCYPEFDVEFTNLLPDSSVVAWYWLFGESEDTTFNTAITSHTFNSNIQQFLGSSLTVIDSFGCDKRLTKEVFFIKPDPDFFFDYSAFPSIKLSGTCIYDTINFMPTSSYSSDSSHWLIDTAFFNLQQPSYSFSNWGDIPIKHTVFYRGCTDTLVETIEIELANAEFLTADTVQECNLEMKFYHDMKSGKVIPDKSLWTFDTLGHTGEYYNDTIYFTYSRPGAYKPKLRIETKYGCKDSTNLEIEILKPWAEYNVSDDEVCTHDTFSFYLDTMMYSTNYYWVMENNEIIDARSVDRILTENGTFTFGIHVENDSIPNCTFDEAIKITAHHVEADFTFAENDTVFCHNDAINILNNSLFAINYLWKSSEGLIDSLDTPDLENPNVEGNYWLKLNVKNDFGCTDSLQKVFFVRDSPEIDIIESEPFCEGTDSLQMILSINQDDLNFTWLPENVFTQNNIKDAWIVLNETTEISVIAENKDNCYNTDSITIGFIKYPVLQRSLNRYDTLIHPGAYLKLGVSSNNNSTYSWKPYFEVDQPNESSTTVNPEGDSTIFYITIVDECFVNIDSFLVLVEPRPIVTMPNAFYPMGNEKNRKVFVRGIGIIQLLEFSVYNRWGNEVFRTDDLNEGWTGYKDGQLLPQGPYAYIVRVKDYLNEEHFLKGNIVLLY